MNNNMEKFEDNYIDLMKYFDSKHLFDIVNAKIDFSNKKVLDLGCGEGTNTMYLLQYSSEVIGLDLSKKFIKYCNRLKNYNSNTKFILGDAYRLPFSDHYFDIIFTFCSLHEFKNLGKSLSEMKRVLKRDGTIISIEPLQKSNWTHIEYLIKRVYCPNEFVYTDLFWVSYLTFLYKSKFKWKYYPIKPRFIFPNFSTAYDLIMRNFNIEDDLSECGKKINDIILKLPNKNKKKIVFHDDCLLVIAKGGI